MKTEHVKVVRRHSSCMKILHVRTGLEVYSCRPQARNCRDQRGHVVAQHLPLLTIGVFPLAGGLGRPTCARVNYCNVLRMWIGQLFQEECVSNRKDCSVCADGKRKSNYHDNRKRGIAPQITESDLEMLNETFHSEPPQPR